MRHVVLSLPNILLLRPPAAQVCPKGVLNPQRRGAMLLLAEACFLAPAAIRGSTGLQPVAVRIPACFHEIIRTAGRQTKPRSLTGVAGTAVSVAADRNKQNIRRCGQSQIFIATGRVFFARTAGMLSFSQIAAARRRAAGANFVSLPQAGPDTSGQGRRIRRLRRRVSAQRGNTYIRGQQGGIS